MCWTPSTGRRSLVPPVGYPWLGQGASTAQLLSVERGHGGRSPTAGGGCARSAVAAGAGNSAAAVARTSAHAWTPVVRAGVGSGYGSAHRNRPGEILSSLKGCCECVTVGKLPRERLERSGLGCVRSLRTQQRVSSRCQVLVIAWAVCSSRRGVGGGLGGGCFLGSKMDVGCDVCCLASSVCRARPPWGWVRCAVWLVCVLFVGVWVGRGSINGEFDPGSGRTLAACLTNASRTLISSLLG